ncbi:hypothetical protein PSEUDO8AS_60101 [Pseudomonas sp. 8AS]|nr:hypothetical protein PSEUDO8AS_60101 [Pseudomonas sp. 8AS]
MLTWRCIDTSLPIIIPADIHLRIVRFVPCNTPPQTPPIRKSNLAEFSHGTVHYPPLALPPGPRRRSATQRLRQGRG